MHPPELRSQARALRARGHTIHSAARTLSLPYATVWHWCVDRPERARLGTELRCFRCLPDVENPTDPAAYSYLLGLYLGDGHLAVSPKVPVLRIACTAIYPNLTDACEVAMLAVLAARVQRIPKQGCISVESSGVHWPCLLPQHGPGKKHERPIILADWQRVIVTEHPGDFLRGLFHSDGCRCANRVTVRGKEYVYPRYMFSNRSVDIMALCQWSRREAVAALDRHVGPKS